MADSAFPAPPNFERALLKVLEPSPTTIDFWLNPASLTVSHSATWKERPRVAPAQTAPSYGGANGATIGFTVMLHAAYGHSPANVKRALDALARLTLPTVSVPQQEQQRPPKVQLVWGQFLGFISFCTSVTQQIEMFDVDGLPMHATATLSLTQAEPEPGDAVPPGQNPTTRATQRRRMHRLRHGESLASVAHAHLGKPDLWPQIATLNDVDDPLRIEPGELLAVPLEEP
ncbi:MAG TPA: hypothetical protein VFZ89_02925 [Solirubrobacteraceae bacterium]